MHLLANLHVVFIRWRYATYFPPNSKMILSRQGWHYLIKVWLNTWCNTMGYFGEDYSDNQMFKQSKTLSDLQILWETLVCCCSLTGRLCPGLWPWQLWVERGWREEETVFFLLYLLISECEAKGTRNITKMLRLDDNTPHPTQPRLGYKCWSLCSDFMCSFPEKIMMKWVLQWARGKGSSHIWWTHDLQRHLWWLQFTLKGSKHRWNNFHYNIKTAAAGLCRQELPVCFLACKKWLL